MPPHLPELDAFFIGQAVDFKTFSGATTFELICATLALDKQDMTNVVGAVPVQV